MRIRRCESEAVDSGESGKKRHLKGRSSQTRTSPGYFSHGKNDKHTSDQNQAMRCSTTRQAGARNEQQINRHRRQIAFEEFEAERLLRSYEPQASESGSRNSEA